MSDSPSRRRRIRRFRMHRHPDGTPKVGYREGEAKQIAAASDDLHAYRCYCRRWHLGHEPTT